ncbi:hypothetical protein CYY_002217 [Polysphondylium violaceum]|uniref:SAM-dependent MTase RsmB/NOP-type domain-containing protein n=1 Tax=Polysphondylium violaceum TaxID=133409 RepID=A0A8J4Q0J7_9MYCE|nr:hypothetical protein CYY_002217 [Polysphondylium violaceum]
MAVDKKILAAAAAKKQVAAKAAPAPQKKVVGAKPVATKVSVPPPKKQTTPSKPQPKKAVKQPEPESEEEDEEEEEEDFSDEEEESTNKSNLFEDDDEEDEDEDDEDFNNRNTKAFSDENQKWLKVKGQEGEDDDEDEEDDEEEDGLEAQSRLIKQKKDKIESENIDEIQKEHKKSIDEEDKLDIEEEKEEGEAQSELMGVDLPAVYQRIKDVIQTLENFAKERKQGTTRQQYMGRLAQDISTYFGYSLWLVDVFLKIFPVGEALEFFEANETHRPLTIRANTLKTRRKDLAEALIARGVHLEPIKWSQVGLTIYDTQVAIGATPEYLAGHYIQQSASSFLPVLALAPQPNERVLDMCASPGGKTTYIAAMMKNTGVLVANDVNKDRIKSLVANIHRLGVKNASVSNLDGREYPTVMGGFDRCLVDAPCVGLGVISKDPQIKLSKSERDVITCTHSQKELLLHAIDSVDADSPTGGIIVYSTCSLTVEENEAVVDYALKKRDVKIVDTTIDFGVQGFTHYRDSHFHPSLILTRRYYPHTHNMDGFYVAKLQKISNKIPNGESTGAKQQVKKRKNPASDSEASNTSSSESESSNKNINKKAKTTTANNTNTNNKVSNQKKGKGKNRYFKSKINQKK